jgi:hypothetical protein
MSLPERYWIWQTFSQAVFRFDAAEADQIASRLDEWHDDPVTPQLGIIRATDLSGSELRLRIAHLDCFHECTPQTREWDRAVSRELEAEQKDWSSSE